jgi:hypothetical protein
MAQNYIRQSIFIDGDTITASLFNNEYNQLVNVFSYSSTSAENTGHRHDGTTGQGGNIPVIGDIDFKNKIVVDGTNNRWGFFVKVAGTTVEQIRIQDGGIVPVTTNDIDLGTSSLQFKDIFIDGTANIDSLVLTSGVTVTTILDEDDLVTNSATALATQQSIKAYVDAQVTAQDLDIVGDTGTDSIDLDSETLTFTGGTGITSVVTAGTVTHNIDSTVTTLTGTQTLTNKTLNGGNIDGTVIGGTTAAAGSFTNPDANNATLAFGSATDNNYAFVQGYYNNGSPFLRLSIQNSEKVKINSTGIDVTGTATMDGLVVDGDVAIASDLPTITITDNNNSSSRADIKYNFGYLTIDADANNVDAAEAIDLMIGGTKHFRLATGGDVSFYEDTGTTAKLTWSASGEDLNFADNVKATFGDGDDLQIYHDGSNSYIEDGGVGNLNVKTNVFRVYNAAGDEISANFVQNGAVTLYHDGAAKLATTSTGIDVTGTATMDGQHLH